MSNGREENELERVRCDLCGSDSTKLYYSARSRYSEEKFNVVRCDGCGLVYVNPRLANKELSIRRHSSDAALAKSQQDTFAPSFIERSHLLAKTRLRRIRGLVGGGRLLDFGCGNGTFVYTALSEGWDAVGIDLNEGMIEAACRYWKGLPLGRGWRNARMEFGGGLAGAVLRHREEDRLFAVSLPEFAGERAGSFDAINSSQVLEHLVSPTQTVAVLAGLLRPGGWLVADVPNIRCWKETVKRGSTLDPTAHLYYFDRSTLSRLLEEQGLEVLYISSRITLFGMWMKLLPLPGVKRIIPQLAHTARLLPIPGLSRVLLVVAKKEGSLPKCACR